MRRLFTIMLAVLVGVLGWLGWLVNHPQVAAAPAGDAIFVHAGGRGERIRLALDLLDAGVAPVLVISDPGVRSSFVPTGLCDSEDHIICVTPSTVDTAGEARALGALVTERGWTDVVVVTSDYHVRRASLLDRSCTTAHIDAVSADRRRSGSAVTNATVQETFGLALSWLFERC